MPKKTVAERLWEKVDRSGGEDACWPWNGSEDGTGYGVISVDGKKVRAHRVAWELANGEPFPEGMLGCHHCDNPPCCNPRHIFVGTMSDNIRDAVMKGRHVPHDRSVQTHCKRGHAFTPENTSVRANGHRDCKACRDIRNAARRWDGHSYVIGSARRPA